MLILCVFETDVFIVQKCFFAISFFHNLFSRSITWGYMEIHGVKGGYKGLQGVTRGYKGLQGVTKDYRNLFSS